MPPNGLVGYWSFNEGSGSTAADGSGNGHTGSLQYSPTWATTGSCRVGGCLSFDGTDDYVRVADSAPLRITGNLTLSAWIKPTGARSVQSVVSKRYEFELGPVQGTGALSAELVAQGVERHTRLRQPGSGDGEQPVAARRSRPRRRHPPDPGLQERRPRTDLELSGRSRHGHLSAQHRSQPGQRPAFPRADRRGADLQPGAERRGGAGALRRRREPAASAAARAATATTAPAAASSASVLRRLLHRRRLLRLLRRHHQRRRHHHRRRSGKTS